MRLGIITHKRFETDGDSFASRGGFGRSVEVLGDYFDEVLLFVPVHLAEKPVGYVIQRKNFRYVPLPPNNGRTDELRHLHRTYSILRDGIKDCDVLQVRVGSIIAAAGLLAARQARKPFFVSIATDDMSVRRAHGPFLKILPMGPISLATELVTRNLARGQFCFVLGSALHDLYGRYTPFVHETVETVLGMRDLLPPRPRCEKDRVRILFVGRLSREKGLTYLVDALTLTRPNVCLDIVGDGGEGASLQAQVMGRGLQERVTFCGYVPMGERLWQHYEKADIFVLPSLSEAQGKVILEAQARSVPVIASKVGGIPTLIQDRSNGLLVRAGSPQALAAAIEEIIADVPLREHIINAGLMTARRFTMEEVTEEQIRLLNEHFGLGIQRRSAVAT